VKSSTSCPVAEATAPRIKTNLEREKTFLVSVLQLIDCNILNMIKLDKSAHCTI